MQDAERLVATVERELADKEKLLEEWVARQTAADVAARSATQETLRKGSEDVVRLKARVEELKAAVRLHQKDVAEQQSGHEQFVDEIGKGVEFYRSRLGLSFAKAEKHRLRFTFTKIDPTNEERPFAFSVFLVDNKYFLEEIVPEVRGADDLLQELNRTNDFSRFVRQMRERFKELVDGSK